MKGGGKKTVRKMEREGKRKKGSESKVMGKVGVEKGLVLTSEVVIATRQHQGNGRSLSPAFHQGLRITSLLTSSRRPPHSHTSGLALL